MEIADFRRSVSHTGIRGLRALNKVMGERMDTLCQKLTEALPSNLQDRFGCYDAVSDLVWSGGHSFFLFEDVGLELDDGQKEEWFEKGRKLIAPVIEAWEGLGVVLDKVDFLSANNGLIEAHLVVK